MTSPPSITRAAADFVDALSFDALPAEALRVGERCLIDGIGLIFAGATEKCVDILRTQALDQSDAAEATLLGAGAKKVSAPLAGRIIGTSGHAHDWDDTQVSHDARHVYGLLTHPTIPPLAAALVVAQKLGDVDGTRFITAFQAGFEVECKIAEWMRDRHYRRGHHSSGTVGTFGACVAAAKLLGLRGRDLANAIGIAASFSAGIRVNFGTMTKPLHVGRAVENGVTAALLAQKGFQADPEALDGPWGFFAVMGEGLYEEKISQGFGDPLTIVSPGVSVKPYPSGILTHQSMDAMLQLVLDADLQPENIKQVRFYAGKNILEPIRYPIAVNELEAKFSMPALLAMIALKRRASHREFKDEFVASAEMQHLQRVTTMINDPEIDAKGYDKIRSRIEVDTLDGKTLVQWADENYRGGPSKPISDADLEAKFRMCAEDIIPVSTQDRVLDLIKTLPSARWVKPLLDCLAFEAAHLHALPAAGRPLAMAV